MSDAASDSPTTEASPRGNAVSYVAQTAEGRAIRGSVEAADGAEAMDTLRRAGLQSIELQPEPLERGKGKALRGADFQAFNQQLAQLASAGLPLERGLRLIAQEMSSKRMARTVDAVADDLEAGQSLEDAIERRRGAFPPLYGSLLKMGARTGRLTPLLLGLGRHIVLTERLRAEVWRSASYPLVILLALGAVLVFFGMYVAPGLRDLISDLELGRDMPWITSAVFAALGVVPWVIVPLMGLALGTMVGGLLHPRMRAWLGGVVDSLPLFKRILRASRTARWCDSLEVALSAGLPLPEALRMSGELLGDRRFARDSEGLAALHEQGQKLDSLHPREIVPPVVTAGIDFGMTRGDLQETLRGYCDMYREQAETWMSVLHTILTPILLLGIAIILGLVMVAMLMPLLTMMMWL